AVVIDRERDGAGRDGAGAAGVADLDGDGAVGVVGDRGGADADAGGGFIDVQYAAGGGAGEVALRVVVRAEVVRAGRQAADVELVGAVVGSDESVGVGGAVNGEGDDAGRRAVGRADRHRDLAVRVVRHHGGAERNARRRLVRVERDGAGAGVEVALGGVVGGE